MKSYQAKKILSISNRLGESPLWCDRLSVLYWLDILGKKLYRFSPKKRILDKWSLHFTAGAILLSESDNILILVTDEGIIKVDINQIEKEINLNNCKILTPYPEDKSLTRPNEAKADPYGNILFSTIGYDSSQAIGNYYIYSSKGVRIVHTHLYIPNTLIWVPANSHYHLYFFDTFLRQCYRCHYHEEIAQFNPIKIYQIDKEAGDPDGSSLDENNTLWNARWGAGQIVHTDLHGKKLDAINLPAKQPTSVTFGGDKRSTLFITTASYGLSSPSDGDGALYEANLPVKGIKENLVKQLVIMNY